MNSLITTNKLKNHTIFKKKPINFKINERSAKTQDLEPAEIMVYSIMMWKVNTFVKSYKKIKKLFYMEKLDFIQ